MFVREVTETSAILDWSTTALVPGGKPEVVKELPDNTSSTLEQGVI